MIDIVSLFAREEAIVRQQLATVARRQHDLVPLAFLAAPVLEGAVLGVVDEAELHGVLGVHVGVQAAGVSGPLLRSQTDDAADGGADAVRADDEVVLGSYAVVECDDTSVKVDVFALKAERGEEKKY